MSLRHRRIKHARRSDAVPTITPALPEPPIPDAPRVACPECGAGINPRFAFRTCTQCAIKENARDCVDYRRERALASRARLLAAGLLKPHSENADTQTIKEETNNAN
jgi:hypothetical protein